MFAYRTVIRLSMIVVVLSLALTATLTGAQDSGWTETFDDADLPGWELSPDVTVADGVLWVSGQGSASFETDTADFTLSVRARFVSEPAEIVLSYREDEAGAYQTLIGLEYAVLGYTNLDPLGSTGFARLEGWFKIGVVVQGNQHVISINDQPVLAADDTSQLAGGNIGFRVLGEQAIVEFDDFQLSATGEVPSQPNPAAASCASENSRAGITISAAMLRETSSTQATVVQSLPANTSLTIAATEEGETVTSGGVTSSRWYHVCVGESQGYVWSGLVRKDIQTVWVRTGGPLGGLGYDIRMRPDTPDAMYVTDAWGGAFSSADGGQTWVPTNQGITTRGGDSGDVIPVFSLTIDPHNYDTIWVGTQNMRGIFKSTDGGLTWIKMDNGVSEQDGISFRGFTVDPQSSDIVYAAGELSSWAWAGEERWGREFDRVKGVVYRTTNGGQSWTAIWRGDNLARYVWIDPRDSNVIYVSTGIFDREAANSDPNAGTPGGVGIVKSTDGGQTWTAINNGLDNLYVGSLFMNPDNPDSLLAGTGNNQYYQYNGVYLSTDGGASWQHTLSNDNITSVEFALADSTIAYAASADAIYRSSDGGQHWQTVAGGKEKGWGSPGVRAGFPIDLQVDPRDPDRIFANNYGGGNFLSEDGGQTWVDASEGYTGAVVRDIAVDSADAGHVYAAARSGVFVSYDAGGTWDGLNHAPAFSLEWNTLALDATDAQHVLAANDWNMMILQSRNGGKQWALVSNERSLELNWQALAFAPSDPATAYAGGCAFYHNVPGIGVYTSHNGGTTWSEANDSHSQGACVVDLAVAPDDPLVVYAAAPNAGLLKSTDGGQTWITPGLNASASSWVQSVAVHPQNSSSVFVGLGHGGLLHSADNGQTWQFSGIGLNPEATISDIVFDPTDPEIMYASDRLSGVYHSEDSGQTWTAVNNGLHMRNVNALAISSDGQHLYAATEGGGVYRLDVRGIPPTTPAE